MDDVIFESLSEDNKMKVILVIERERFQSQERIREMELRSQEKIREMELKNQQCPTLVLAGTTIA